MAVILFSFDVCLSVCVRACVSVRSGPDNHTNSKRLKLRPSKFDVRVPRDSPDMIPYIFSKKGRGQGHLLPKFLGVKC